MKCPYCKGTNIVKYGRRKTRYKLKQLYKCNACGRKFIEEKDFEKYKGGKEVTIIICDLHRRGLSLRDISSHLKRCYNIELDHSNVLRRVRRYDKNRFD